VRTWQAVGEEIACNTASRRQVILQVVGEEIAVAAS